MSNLAGHKFVADVGGTNIRLAIVENGRISVIKKYLCANFETIADAILHFKEDIQAPELESACIAIACPVDDDLVKMTNHTWRFSKQALQKELGLEKLFVINDFAAVAHSLPTLNHNQVIQIGEGHAMEHGNISVFGPGTGLGVEHLTWTQSGWKTLNGEGGHVDYAPTSEDDVIVWRYLNNKLGRVSSEELLSGRGIVNIYHALCEDAGISTSLNKPSEVANAGLDNSDAIARKALSQFCDAMGSFAGNLAINLRTTGGVFIGGGVIGNIQEFFLASGFREKFEAKGHMSDYVKPIPTYLINEPDHGLLGALAYLTQQSQ